MANKEMSKIKRQQKPQNQFCLDYVETSPNYHILTLNEGSVYHKPYWELLVEEEERKAEEEAKRKAEEEAAAKKLAEEEAKRMVEMTERKALWKELETIKESMRKIYNEKSVAIECQAIERTYKNIEKHATWLTKKENAVGWFFRNLETYFYKKCLSSSHYTLNVSLFIEKVFGTIRYNPNSIFYKDSLKKYSPDYVQTFCEDKRNNLIRPAKENYENAEKIRKWLNEKSSYILHCTQETFHHYCNTCIEKGTCSRYRKDAPCDLVTLRIVVKITRDSLYYITSWCNEKKTYDRNNIKGIKYEQDRLWETLRKVEPLYKIAPNYIAIGAIFLLIILLIIFKVK